ncbi:hypothetical protein AC781_10110 [Akkermansia glycaniphila]|nr:hypothetical protein AC781_10110 [Akkermansia glycaniphila]
MVNTAFLQIISIKIFIGIFPQTIHITARQRLFGTFIVLRAFGPFIIHRLTLLRRLRTRGRQSASFQEAFLIPKNNFCKWQATENDAIEHINNYRPITINRTYLYQLRYGIRQNDIAAIKQKSGDICNTQKEKNEKCVGLFQPLHQVVKNLSSIVDTRQEGNIRPYTQCRQKNNARQEAAAQIN